MTRTVLDQTRAIEDQTRQALHKQRQKGRFKLKKGPGRPEELESHGWRPNQGSSRKSMEYSSSLPQILPSSSRDSRRNNAQKESAAVVPDIESLKSNMFPPNEVIEKRIAEAHREIAKLSHSYNGLKHQNEIKEKQIKELQDELIYLRKEDDVEETSNILSKEIKQYEAKLALLEDEFEQTASYRETLVMMKQRLIEEKTPHTKVLKAFEEALKVQLGENEEIKLMARQVLQAKEIEEKELERRKQELEAEKKGWAAKLKEGEALAKKREDMKKWFEERKEQAQSDKISQRAVVAKMDEAQILDKMGSLKEEIAQYQMIFEKMEIVTGFGMTEPEEVAKRCNSRKEQADAAMKQETELLNRLESLSKEKKQLVEELESVKIVGPGSTEFNREMMDNLSSLNTKLCEKERTLKSKCAKHKFALVEIDQTLNNLLRKLSKIKIDSSQEHGTVEKTDTISHKLETITSKVSRILSEFAAMGVPLPTFSENTMIDVSDMLGLESLDIQKDSNIRVSAVDTDLKNRQEQWFNTYGEGKPDDEEMTAEIEKNARRDLKNKSKIFVAKRNAPESPSARSPNNFHSPDLLSKRNISDRSLIQNRSLKASNRTNFYK